MGPAQQKPTSGNQNDDFPKINHEVFSNRTIVKNGPEEESILVKVAVPHQKDYQAWADKLKKVGQSEGLLLPKKHNFQKEGFCGMSGVVEVHLLALRSTTKSTPSSSPTKSTTGSAWAPSSSSKTNSGISP